MSQSEFRDGVVQALIDENEAALSELVEGFQPAHDAQANEIENDALISIGKFGCSGRTDRYCRYVNQLLRKGLRPNLVACAYLGLFEEAKLELQRLDVGVNTANGSGIYPLHAAAERGELAMVSWLCEQEADPTLLSTKNEMPIALALHAGPWKQERAYDVAEYLAPRCGASDKLWFLAASGNTNRLKAELERRPNGVDEAEESGATPLYHACHNNHLGGVRVLLAAGAKATPEMLDTACLHYLSRECEIGIVKALIDAGVPRTLEVATIEDDVNWVTKHFELIDEHTRTDQLGSSLEYAVHGKAPGVLAALIQLGIRPDAATWRHIERIFSDDQSFLGELRRGISASDSG